MSLLFVSFVFIIILIIVTSNEGPDTNHTITETSKSLSINSIDADSISDDSINSRLLQILNSTMVEEQWEYAETSVRTSDSHIERGSGKKISFGLGTKSVQQALKYQLNNKASPNDKISFFSAISDPKDSVIWIESFLKKSKDDSEKVTCKVIIKMTDFNVSNYIFIDQIYFESVKESNSSES